MKTSLVSTFLILFVFLHLKQVRGDVHTLIDIWREFNNDATYDIKHSTLIYKKIKGEQQALAELDAVVRRHLKHKYSELLASAINNNRYSKAEEKFREVVEYMLKNYDLELNDGILQDTINDLSVMMPMSELVNALYEIYKNGDLESFELMLIAQIKLYNLYNEKTVKDDQQFLYEYAFVMKKIQNQPLYPSAKMHLKSKLEEFVQKLPENLKYLLFEPHYCLMNAKYSEYIYTAVGSNGSDSGKIDADNRYIWVWHDNPSIDDTSYIVSQVARSHYGNSSSWEVTLKGTKYNIYYYMMNATHVIAGWESKMEPENYIWNIEFIDNERVAFSQNNYLMCSTFSKRDNERRNVDGYLIGVYSSSDPECQWYLGRCDRRKKL